MKPMITCRVLISRVDVNRTTTYKTLKTPLTRGLTHFATRPTRCLPGRQYHCYCCPQLALDCCNSPHLIFAYIHSFTLETVDTWMLRNGGERSSVGYSQGPGQPVGHSGGRSRLLFVPKLNLFFHPGGHQGQGGQGGQGGGHPPPVTYPAHFPNSPHNQVSVGPQQR